MDPEDRLLREEFNRDNANVESGLTTLKQGLETETKSREAAVSAARQEATQAVNAAKQETSQALAAAAPVRWRAVRRTRRPWPGCRRWWMPCPL